MINFKDKKIMVVDSPMGSGKTSAAIRMMNENPDNKYLFVTPYLNESKRILGSCAKLKFKEPRQWDQEIGVCNKTEHVTELLRRGENIVTTHALFGMFTDEIKQILSEQHYILILDEVLSVIDKIPLTKNDWQTLIDTGRVKVDDGNLVTEVDYDYERGDMYFPLKDALSKTDVYRYTDSTFLKVSQIDAFHLFDSVFILTYMFDAQLQCALFKTIGLEYKCIGVMKDGNRYSFTDDPGQYYNPLKGIKNKIKIMCYGKNNAIGDDEHALSSEWYRKDLITREKKRHSLVRRKMYAMVCRGFCKTYRAYKQSLMWTCYENSQKELNIDVLDDSNFVPCNARAENKWKDKTNLLYLVNRYCDPNFKSFFAGKGAIINQEDYALSEMVQWIWRSAIRDGHEIKVYIPSSRMRNLLERWLDEVS